MTIASELKVGDTIDGRTIGSIDKAKNGELTVRYVTAIVLEPGKWLDLNHEIAGVATHKGVTTLSVWSGTSHFEADAELGSAA